MVSCEDENGIRGFCLTRGLGDVNKGQVHECLAEVHGIAPSSCGPAMPDSSDGDIAYCMHVLMEITTTGASALEPR